MLKNIYEKGAAYLFSGRLQTRGKPFSLRANKYAELGAASGSPGGQQRTLPLGWGMPPPTAGAPARAGQSATASSLHLPSIGSAYSSGCCWKLLGRREILWGKDQPCKVGGRYKKVFLFTMYNPRAPSVLSLRNSLSLVYHLMFPQIFALEWKAFQCLSLSFPWRK